MRSVLRQARVLHFLLIALIVIDGIPLSIAIAGDEISVDNVRFKVVGTKVIISYDLIGPADANCKVLVTLKNRSAPSFSYVPDSVTGDVGEGRFVGRGRQVIWDFSTEFPGGLTFEDYYFQVDAERVSGGIGAIVWIGGAVLVAGGATAYFLLSKKEAVEPVDTGFPNPPGRPR
jgi:hypothetical protein